jgi:hypothetical protein
MVMTKKNTVFWTVMLCSADRPDVSEEHITSIFRVEEIAKKKQAAS